ncbi:MAG: hypothetical protein M1829_002721 [Trizodia sp. TS-e1964]|nr:MAG: hypothetical protein M1829_002721 [Trizodia sp. TS-e1964]
MPASTTPTPTPTPSPAQAQATAPDRALPPLKRRRIDGLASTTLSQPFRSPFKRARACPAPAAAAAATPPYLPSRHAHTLPPRRANPAPSTDLRELAATHAHLAAQVLAARSALDTLQAARGLEASGRDAELEGVRAQWKAAARLAAEEVFRRVRDRVNRMGGPRVWHRLQRGGGGWEDGERREAGEEETERERREREGSEEVGGEVDEETFSMDMMLRSMGIGLGVIGYDRVAQRWVE